MKKLKILNLYAGIGGNRKLWGDNHDITAIENVPEIAKIYQDFFPKDKVIVTDAHQYLLDHYKEFDFIWSSPPCPSHSRMRLNHKTKIYPDMRLYQEIILLKHYFKGKYCIENVVSYYKPLIEPQKINRHYYWTNFYIDNINIKGCNVGKANKEELSEYLEIKLPIETKNKRLLLRNCVEPKVGLHIFQEAFREDNKLF